MSSFVSPHFPEDHWETHFPRGRVEEYPDGLLRPIGGRVLSNDPERSLEGRPYALDLQPGAVLASMYDVQRQVFQVSAALEVLHVRASDDAAALAQVSATNIRLADRFSLLLEHLKAVELTLENVSQTVATTAEMLRQEN